jgi:hypothetical protein
VAIGRWPPALVLDETVNRDLFLEPGICGEMFFIFGKIYPFLDQLGEKLRSPVFRNVERLIMTSEAGPERLKQTRERQARLRNSIERAVA